MSGKNVALPKPFCFRYWIACLPSFSESTITCCSDAPSAVSIALVKSDGTWITSATAPRIPESLLLLALSICFTLSENENFAFETTLATKSYKNKIIEAKAKGYRVTLLFFWLQNIDLAKERVKSRVSEGGHNIEPEVIERRYINGIKNLFDIYLPIVDGALIFDNSEGKHELLADKQIDGVLNIANQEKFNLLKKYYDNNWNSNRREK